MATSGDQKLAVDTGRATAAPVRSDGPSQEAIVAVLHHFAVPNDRIWLPSASTRLPEWRLGLACGGSGKWLVRRAGVGTTSRPKPVGAAVGNNHKWFRSLGFAGRRGAVPIGSICFNMS